MILIGQFDSPFVRRVAIAMRLYGMEYEHRPWSVFGDADKIAAVNPMIRVPTLVLDDGEVLFDSTVILACLDDMVGADRALIAATGPDRRKALRIGALATGLADKAVSLIYERALHDHVSPDWIARCERQVAGLLTALETERAAVPTDYWFGAKIGHADIAVACVLRFLSEAHPQLLPAGRYPSLAAHAARCEALEPFQAIFQVFIPPR